MLTSVVLLVMAPPAARQIAAGLESLDGVNVRFARDCREARVALETHPDVSLVFTDVSHADGNWADLLRFVVNRGIRAHVVVCSCQADEGLWSEVLWRGDYDVLVEPFDRAELCRIVAGALRTMNPLSFSKTQSVSGLCGRTRLS